MPVPGPAPLPPVRIECSTLTGVVWQPLPDPLPAGPVVFRMFIPAFSAVLPRLNALLLADEQGRAGRYHQSRDRQRFVVARGLLRLLLGHYTGQHPAAVAFAAGVNKKPVLADFPDWHYNVSHAGNWVLIAVGRTLVGVDVERVDPDFDYPSIGDGYFSSAEQQYIRDADGRAAFYRLWTRKEALTKATAKGIDDDFWRIPALDGEHWVAGDLLSATDDWTVGSFSPADGYAAAVARPTAGQPAFSGFYSVEPGDLNTFLLPFGR